MKSRHELREAVFKILFQIENTELDYKELLELEQEEIANSSYVNNTLTEIIDKLEEIAKKTDSTKSSVIRKGIDKLYQELNKQK